MKSNNSSEKNRDAKQIVSGVTLAPPCAPDESSFQLERSEGSPKTKARRVPKSARKTEKSTGKEECNHYSSDESSEFDKESQPGAYGIAGIPLNRPNEEHQPALNGANLDDGDLKERAILVEADLAPDVTAAQEVNIQEEEAMIIKKKQYKRVLQFAMLFYALAIIGNVTSLVLFFVNPPAAFGRLFDPLTNGLVLAVIFLFIATAVIFIPTRLDCRSSIKLEEYAPDDTQLLRQAQIVSFLSFCLFTFVALPMIVCLPNLQWLAYAFVTWFFAGTVFSFSRVWLLRCSKETRQKIPHGFFLFGFGVLLFVGLCGLIIWYCLNPTYPDCFVPTASYIGNGECEQGPYTSEACGFDGGDCLQFLHDYPGCNVEYPFWISDGECDEGVYNTKECGYDGGDCTVDNQDYPNCNVPHPSWIGDGTCDGRVYGTVECGYDGGDCLKPGERCRRHRECSSEVCNSVTKVCDLPVISDRYPNCSVDLPNWIGDGECDGGYYASEACGFDGGDCLKVGEACSKDEECASGFCNADTKVCYLGVLESYPDCIVEYPKKIGDGNCDGGNYRTEECGYDGGDCASQKSAGFPTLFPTFHIDVIVILLSVNSFFDFE